MLNCHIHSNNHRVCLTLPFGMTLILKFLPTFWEFAHMAYLTIEGAILSHFQWFLHKNWGLKNKTWVGSHGFFFMDTSHGNTNFRIKIYFKNVIFSEIFKNIHLFSLQTLLFWWTVISHQNVTLATKMSNFGQPLVKEFDYVIDILCILTQ